MLATQDLFQCNEICQIDSRNGLMFQLTDKEFENWKSQIEIFNSERMGLRKRPLAFTERKMKNKTEQV